MSLRGIILHFPDLLLTCSRVLEFTSQIQQTIQRYLIIFSNIVI